MRLSSGSRVVIVGGGPAGSFSALHLLREAEAAGLDLDVRVFEGRDFSRPGPGGCNKCAGVLSSSLVGKMKSVGLEIPPDLVQAVLNSYTLHFGRQTLVIERGLAEVHVLSVYRGGGPRLGGADTERSFDAWLLEQARQRGAKIVRRHVERVTTGPRPQVISAGEALEADLVILATGVNSRSPLDPAWGYAPPRCEVMAQNETTSLGFPLGDSVHIFFNQPDGLLFGALVPKGEFTNISLLGENLSPRSIQQFLDIHGVTALTPDAGKELPLLCGCSPRVAVSPAVNYFADRMVTVGDAAVTRLYKNGIGSAFTTAREAARCAVQHGVRMQDFAAGYQPACIAIAADNRFGRLLFEVWKRVRDTRSLRRRWQNALRVEESLPPEKQVHRNLLWNMFTGDRTYTQIFWQALSWPAVWALLKGAARDE